ncbi:MAG TPA: hypothetical protein VNM40_01945 [Candidatus Paceibacterota bacterium]|nr:hypothetical protein [Candidatus Paceibacterota bacterium]
MPNADSNGASRVEQFYKYTEHPEVVPVLWRELTQGWTSETVFELWGPIFPFAMFITLLAGVGIIYCALRIWQIRQAEWAGFRKAQRTVAAEDVPATQLRWNRVLEHANSDDEHKWRLAILEADIMLNELLDLQGYKGETMAEKMKQVDRANFNSIDDAWEAHKVRNRVAHEGVEYHISEREKNKVINLYARVFHEFGFI